MKLLKKLFTSKEDKWCKLRGNLLVVVFIILMIITAFNIFTGDGDYDDREDALRELNEGVQPFGGYR